MGMGGTYMNKFIFLFLISILPIFCASCGSKDFTNISDSKLITLIGAGISNSGKAPAAPSNLQATAIATDKIDIVWENNSSNTAGITIERSAGNNTSFMEIASSIHGEANYYNDTTGLNPGITYFYRIHAFNSTGYSEYSNISSTTTYTSSPLVPVNPSILQGFAVSDSQINLTWNDNSDNETGFKIERRADGEANFSEIASNLPEGTVLYSSTGLNPATTYYYRVRAFNSIGNSGYSNESTAITNDVIPESPNNLTSSAVSNTRINLTWSDNSINETGFKIECRASTEANFTEIANSLPAGTTTYASTGLNPSTVYYYRVRAYNSIGNSGYSSESSAATYANSTIQIIADHTVVSHYNNIPQKWIDEVKKMWINIPGESHSMGYRYGCQLIQAVDSRFAVNVTESGTPEAYTSQHLRISRATWGDYSSSSGWVYGYGEEDFWTNSTAISRTKGHLAYCETHGLSIAAFGFGWCWDMSWLNGPGGTADPVYGVRWAGSSVNGPDGNTIWGLDDADYALTGNHVSLQTYLDAVDDYTAYCASNGYSVRMLFTTGPVDNTGGYNVGESGYQRHLKNEAIRNHVTADSSRILFDYADILSWNDTNPPAQNTTSWNGHAYQLMHPDNMLNIDGSAHSEDGDHIGPRGALRLGKAIWWMLARIAGWDGISQ